MLGAAVRAATVARKQRVPVQAHSACRQTRAKTLPVKVSPLPHRSHSKHEVIMLAPPARRAQDKNIHIFVWYTSRGEMGKRAFRSRVPSTRLVLDALGERLPSSRPALSGLVAGKRSEEGQPLSGRLVMALNPDRRGPAMLHSQLPGLEKKRGDTPCTQPSPMSKMDRALPAKQPRPRRASHARAQHFAVSLHFPLCG